MCFGILPGLVSEITNGPFTFRFAYSFCAFLQANIVPHGWYMSRKLSGHIFRRESESPFGRPGVPKGSLGGFYAHKSISDGREAGGTEKSEFVEARNVFLLCAAKEVGAGSGSPAR